MAVRRTYTMAANGHLTVTDANAGNLTPHYPPTIFSGPAGARAFAILTVDANGTWDLTRKHLRAANVATARAPLSVLLADLGQPPGSSRAF
jgi:hypothetical protein